MKKLHFHVNPQAGRGRAEAAWLTVRRRLHGLGYSLDSEYLSMSNALRSDFDFSALAKDTVLVAVGGDGSIHHTAAIALQHGLTLGIVPAGTGNDYASTLGLPQDPEAALERILYGTVCPVDVIKAADQVILNAGGFGLDASVVHFIEAHPWLKRRGSFGYSLALPLVLGGFRPFSVRVLGDDFEQSFAEVSLVALANGPSFGGGMKIVPAAQPYDGKIELCVVAKLSKPELLRVFPRIFKGTHVSHRSVHMFRGEGFRLEFRRTTNYGQYDGEPIAVPESLEVAVLPGGLRVLR